jgi:phosphohistidine phosphatase
MADTYELYLIRHAIAEDRGEKWRDDTRRPLTSEGRDRMRRAARGLSRLGVKLDLVLTSPLVRARQTAEIVAAALDPQPPITTAASLSPGGTYAAVLADLEKHARRHRLALVGHEPGIGELAARLVGSRQPFEFKKGAVCLIELQALPPPRPGSLHWFVTPAILRAIKQIDS